MEYQKNMKILNLMTGVMALTILILHIVLFAFFCDKEDPTFIEKLGLATGIEYTFLGILFLISGSLLMRKIKLYY